MFPKNKTSVINHNGGELPLEKMGNSKYVLQDFEPLETCMLWKLLREYYRKMALSAWSSNHVPMFVTSNSRFAKIYAKAFYNLMKNLFQFNSSLTYPIYLVEVGAGHGRFTYLFLKHLLHTQSTWKSCNIPTRPFVYIYTDVADANIEFCKNHVAMKQFIENGFLDFAFFDANFDMSLDSSQLYLHYSKMVLPSGHPVVLIGNYVLDSLVTDALQIAYVEKEGKPDVEYRRSLIKIYLPKPILNIDNPDIMSQMSVEWRWARIEVPNELRMFDATSYNMVESCESACYLNLTETLSGIDKVYYNDLHALSIEKHLLLKNGKDFENGLLLPCPQYITDSKTIQSLLKAYASKVLKDRKSLSFVLPVGAFRLFHFMHSYSRNQLILLIGDKGYNDTSEFEGEARYPHIAVHGAVSFMVNLHSIQVFVRALNGSCFSSPYRDTFQLLFACVFSTIPYNILSEGIMGFLALDLEDAPPDTLLSWQRYCLEQMQSQKSTEGVCLPQSVQIKMLLNLLRYSAHDPDVFLNFSSQWISLTSSLLGIRHQSDMQKDVERVFENWYKIGNEDLPDILAHISIKLGRLDRAIFFFEQSLIWCPELKHVATYVNIAACYKALGDVDKASHVLKVGLQQNPNFLPALELHSQLEMCQKRLRVAFIGCGERTETELFPTLLKDHRIVCVACFSFNDLSLSQMKNNFDFDALKKQSREVIFYSGATGFATLLKDEKIEGCIVDLHPNLLLPITMRLWMAGKHTFFLPPVSFTSRKFFVDLSKYVDLNQEDVLSIQSGNKDVESKKAVVCYCVTPFKYEEAFQTVSSLILKEQFGTLLHVSYTHMSQEYCNESAASSSHAMNAREILTIEVFNGIRGISTLVPHLHLFKVSARYSEKAKTYKEHEEEIAPSIFATLSFLNKRSSVVVPPVLGTITCSCKATENCTTFCLYFMNGKIILEKSTNVAWSVTLINGKTKKIMTFPSDGLTGAYDQWLSQIQLLLKRKEKSVESYKDALSQCEVYQLKNNTPDQLNKNASGSLVLNTSFSKLTSEVFILDAIAKSLETEGRIYELKVSQHAKAATPPCVVNV